MIFALSGTPADSLSDAFLRSRVLFQGLHGVNRMIEATIVVKPVAHSSKGLVDPVMQGFHPRRRQEPQPRRVPDRSSDLVGDDEHVIVSG
jgi:hypothetical protein